MLHTFTHIYAPFNQLCCQPRIFNRLLYVKVLLYSSIWYSVLYFISIMATRVNKDDDMKDVILALKTSFETFSTSMDKKIDGLSAQMVRFDEENKTNLKTLNLFAKNLNDREQHSCNASIRITGVEIPDKITKDAISTLNHVFTNVISPILSIAVAEGVLPEVPPMWQVFEMAHSIPKKPGKSQDKSVAQVIIRFQSRLIHQLVFKYKKQFLNESGLKNVFLSEDLTKVNYDKLREVKSKQDTKSAWTLGGRIYYSTLSEPDIKKRY